MPTACSVGIEVSTQRTEVFSVSLVIRFVGRRTSFFWKDDIRAEAMTWAGIPRLHAWKVAVIVSSQFPDSGAPGGLWEGRGRTVMDGVTPL